MFTKTYMQAIAACLAGNYACRQPWTTEFIGHSGNQMRKYSGPDDHVGIPYIATSQDQSMADWNYGGDKPPR